jgi:hypothetical protein
MCLRHGDEVITNGKHLRKSFRPWNAHVQLHVFDKLG